RLAAGDKPSAAFVLSSEAALSGAESTKNMHAQTSCKPYDLQSNLQLRRFVGWPFLLHFSEILAYVPDPRIHGVAAWYRALKINVKVVEGTQFDRCTLHKNANRFEKPTIILVLMLLSPSIAAVVASMDWPEISTYKDQNIDITDSCSQMMLHLHDFYDPEKINIKIEIVSGTPCGAVDVEAKLAQANWVVLDNLRMLLHMSTTPQPCTGVQRIQNSELEDLWSARSLVSKVLQDGLEQLQKEATNPRLSIRWELGACWVQHLQNHAPENTDAKKTEEAKVEPAVKGLGKHGGLLKEIKKKTDEKSLNAEQGRDNVSTNGPNPRGKLESIDDKELEKKELEKEMMLRRNFVSRAKTFASKTQELVFTLRCVLLLP
ncbi:hypothetical protein IFM89_028776, partial [Coptis chinensis]